MLTIVEVYAEIHEWALLNVHHAEIGVDLDVDILEHCFVKRVRFLWPASDIDGTGALGADDIASCSDS